MAQTMEATKGLVELLDFLYRESEEYHQTEAEIKDHRDRLAADVEDETGEEMNLYER